MACRRSWTSPGMGAGTAGFGVDIRADLFELRYRGNWVYPALQVDWLAE